MNRAQWLRLHKYIGLAMAAFLAVQALNGTLLLYREPASRLLDPAGMTSQAGLVGEGGPARSPLSPGTAVARAAQVYPAMTVTRLYAPAAPDSTYFAELTGPKGQQRYASVDPADGRVLRAGTAWAFPVQAALNIHYQLMSGTTGLFVVLLNGVALLAMAGTGLAYWWPKRGPWSKQLTVRWTMAGRLVLRQVHRTVGVVASVVLLFMAITGILLAVPDLMDPSAPPPTRPTAAAPDVDRSLALAQAAFPASALRDFRLTDERLMVNFFAPERNPRAVHRVAVTLADPHIVSTIRAQDNPALWITVLPLHAGNAFGAIGPAVLMLVAITLLGLSLTGPVMWWQARRMRRRPQASGPSA